jgi:hypothetical protein
MDAKFEENNCHSFCEKRINEKVNTNADERVIKVIIN